jgi:hypothetical protein
MHPRSAGGSAGCHVGNEFFGPLDAHGWRISETGVATPIEEDSKALSFCKCLVSTSNPNRVGADENCNLSPMASDGDFLAGRDAVKDFRQRCTGFTY